MNASTTETAISSRCSAGEQTSRAASSEQGTPGAPDGPARQWRDVRESVFMLLQKTDRTEDRRWKPRILFVRSAELLLEEGGSDQPDAETARGPRVACPPVSATSQPLADKPPVPPAAKQTSCLSSMDVVTTDISTRGVGVLSPTALPAGPVVLRFPEVDFLCEALWSEQVGRGFYRHGLEFQKVIETRPGI